MTNSKSIYRNPHFVRFIVADSATGVATWGFAFLLGLTIIADRLTAVELGLLLGCRTVGFLLGVVLGGLAGDQFARRKVIFWAGIVAAAGIMMLMLGFAVGVYIAYLSAVIAGLGQGISRPAFQAYLPNLVEPAQLQAANAMLSLSVRVSILLGPVATTVLVSTLGVNWAYAILCGLWLLSALLPPWVLETHLEATHIDKPNNPLHAFIEGAHEARRHPWFVSSLLALTLVIALGYSATNVILPMVSARQGGMLLMTSCITAYTVGAIIAALVLNKIMVQRVGWLALLGMASYGFAPLSLLFTDAAALPLAGYFLAGFGIELFNVFWFSAIQREIPKKYLSRVSSFDFLLSYGFAPIGLSLIAPMTTYAGINGVLLICALVCLVPPVLVMIFVPSSQTYSVKRG